MKDEVIRDLNSSAILVDELGEYSPISELEAANKEISDLTRQNQELMAQVEYLRTELKDPIEMEFNDECKCSSTCLYCSEELGSRYADMEEHAKSCVHIPTNKTPSQCLAEVKAQAGRDAVVSALRLYGEPSMTVSEIDLLADRCADSIRQQAKGGEL